MILSMMANKKQDALVKPRLCNRNHTVDHAIKQAFPLLPVAEPLLAVATATVEVGKLLMGVTGKLALYPNYLVWTNSWNSKLRTSTSFILPLASVTDCFRTGSFLTVAVQCAEETKMHLPIDRPMVDVSSVFRGRGRGQNKQQRVSFTELFSVPNGEEVTVYLLMKTKSQCIELLRGIQKAKKAVAEVLGVKRIRSCGSDGEDREGTDGVVGRTGSEDAPSTQRVPSILQPEADADTDAERLLTANLVNEVFDDILTWDNACAIGKVFGYISATETPGEEEMEGLMQLFSQAKRERYVDHETVIHAGSTNRRLLHILRGHVTIRSNTGAVIARVGHGKTLGELTFFEVGNRGSGTRVVAEQNLSVLIIDYDMVEVITYLHPKVGARFFRSLSLLSAERMIPYLEMDGSNSEEK